jgi:phospholipid/cholesterol/gamma-HCH transport system ATP-binding protein
MNDSSSKILISKLFKSFGTKKVLEGVDLKVSKGDSLVVIGGSGSGKSVLIKTIAGLIKPDSGSVKIDEVEVNNISSKDYNKLTHKFGFLFQGGALFDSLPIWENVAFGLIQSLNMNREEAKSIALKKLAAVGLEENIALLYPAELSGGMQKRVSLARAIATDPEIIFFDEPTTGLDPIMANIINDLIVKCSNELGATTITITHDMESVKRIAKKVAMLYKGSIIWQGDAGNLFKSDNEYVTQFVNGHMDGPIKVELQDH